MWTEGELFNGVSVGFGVYSSETKFPLMDTHFIRILSKEKPSEGQKKINK